MQQQKSKKIFFYFFLFLILGSITNTGLNKSKISFLKNVNVSGLNEKDNLIISNKIKNLKLQNIFFININEIKNIIEKNTTIENYKILKIYPSSLDIKIKKTNFLAQISDKGKNYLIGSNGKLSENIELNNKLPFVFGRPGVQDFLNFKKIIDQSQFSYSEIKNLYFFPSKRWDIELKNKIIIKLPIEDIKYSLDHSYKFYKENNFLKFRVIDARIKNQIIIQ